MSTGAVCAVQPSIRTYSERMTFAAWTCAAVTLISAGVSAGFAFGGLRGSTGAARTASKYGLARSLALLITAIAALVIARPAFIVAITLAMILVQAFDTVVGATIRDRMKTYGPAGLAVAHAAALAWMLVS